MQKKQKTKVAWIFSWGKKTPKKRVSASEGQERLPGHLAHCLCWARPPLRESWEGWTESLGKESLPRCQGHLPSIPTLLNSLANPGPFPLVSSFILWWVVWGCPLGHLCLGTDDQIHAAWLPTLSSEGHLMSLRWLMERSFSWVYFAFWQTRRKPSLGLFLSPNFYSFA